MCHTCDTEFPCGKTLFNTSTMSCRLRKKGAMFGLFYVTKLISDNYIKSRMICQFWINAIFGTEKKCKCSVFKAQAFVKIKVLFAENKCNL